jgi:hypothetical protein
LPGEDRQGAHVDALEAPERILDLERLPLLADVEDDQAALAQLLADLGLRFGLEFAADCVPARSIALKAKVLAPGIGYTPAA